MRIIKKISLMTSLVVGLSVFADWKYTVEDGKATIVETTHTSGDVIIPSEIDGHSVVSIRDGLFAGCTSLKSIVIPESVTNVVVESKSLMDVDGAVAAYEFKGTLDDGTGYAPSGNGSFAADRFGIPNSAYYFNGQEQRFVNTQRTIEGTFSFGFWFKTDVEMSSTGSYTSTEYKGRGHYILFPKHGGVDRGYGAIVGTDGIKVMAHGDSYLEPIITYSNVIGSGWNHAVVTVSDSTNIKLYLNGVCVANGTGPSATAIFRVDAGGNYGFYTGYLDDLVVCDRALDDAGVKELYSWTAASFAGCNGIVDVTMPGVILESMAEMFPSSYASVTNVVLTGGVAQIPSAFSGCEALESVTLAESGATLALGGDKGWRFDEGGVLRSGKITHNESSSMSMTVQGEGRLTYRWKASCKYYNRFILDYAYLSVDGDAKGKLNNYTLSGIAIGGNTDWQEVSVDVSGEGAHDIAWTFAKDDQDDASVTGEYCAWVDAITYEPFIKLTFDVDEGDGSVPALIKDVRGASVSLPTGEGFAKAKHTFVGWSDGVQTYASGGAYEIGTANTVLTAVYSPNTLAAPVISSVDVASGGEITTAAARIEITAEGDTAIYYTLDGSTPTSGSLLYGGAFDADGLGQVTVKAIAVRDNYFDSDVAEFTFTRRPYSAAECLNAGTMTFTMSGDAEWSRVLDEASHDGDAALKSGEISHGNLCTVETKVAGPGMISFWWKVSSEIFRDWPLDIVSFTVDGVEQAWLGGVKDWTNIVVDITAPGEHTLCWTYKKDEQGEAGEDCAWLDEVVWMGGDKFDITYENLKGATHQNPLAYYEGMTIKFSAPSTVDGYAFAGWTPSEIVASDTGDKVVTANWEWAPQDAVVDASVTGRKPVTVKADWAKTELEQKFGSGKEEAFIAKFGDDLASAMTKKTGKRDGAGNELLVWHDYVAGTDPTDINSTFKVNIEMKDGKPIISWEPNLNSLGEERVYTVHGKEKLSDIWHSPIAALDHFFKVAVAMPREGTVTFNVGGGSSVSPVSIRVGQPIGELPTPTRDGYTFLGWFTASEGGVAVTPKTVVTADITIYARWEADHDKIQLWEGGPYWATTNIGAEKPEDYGYYFWWGDTVGYKRENDKWVASDGSNSNFSFDEDNAPTYNKSDATVQSEGWITADGVLAPEHDAAKKHWGGDWRMPTKQEFDDLNSKCDWTWTPLNGVNGYVIRGRGDYASNSIFLPCAGSGGGTSLGNAGSNGFYWSSVLSSGRNNAWSLNFGSGFHIADYRGRYRGQCVRPLQGFTK